MHRHAQALSLALTLRVEALSAGEAVRRWASRVFSAVMSSVSGSSSSKRSRKSSSGHSWSASWLRWWYSWLAVVASVVAAANMSPVWSVSCSKWAYRLGRCAALTCVLGCLPLSTGCCCPFMVLAQEAGSGGEEVMPAGSEGVRE